MAPRCIALPSYSDSVGHANWNPLRSISPRWRTLQPAVNRLTTIGRHRVGIDDLLLLSAGKVCYQQQCRGEEQSVRAQTLEVPEPPRLEPAPRPDQRSHGRNPASGAPFRRTSARPRTSQPVPVSAAPCSHLRSRRIDDLPVRRWAALVGVRVDSHGPRGDRLGAVHITRRTTRSGGRAYYASRQRLRTVG